MEFDAAEIRRQLQELRLLDLQAISFKELKDFIKNGFLIPLFTRIHAGNYIERIRLNKEEEIFTRPSELSYVTDPNKITHYGRANAPGSAIFYGSVVSSSVPLPHIVALAETEELLRGEEKGHRDKKFIMTVSRWRIAKDMILAEMVFSKSAIAKQPEVRKAYEFHLNLLRKDFPADVVSAFSDILIFFSNEFAKAGITSDLDYKLSAAFSETLYELDMVQGIIYPSVRTELAGTNVALLPVTVDECLFLEEALILLVDIRGTRVFLEKLFHTIGPISGNDPFRWQELQPTPSEVITEFFSTGRLPQS